MATAKTVTTSAQNAQRISLVRKLATKFGVDDDKMLATLKATAFRQPKGKDDKPAPEVTNEQMMALLVVADQYNLNPFTKEIYAFPDKSGGIVPIVSIDGWVRIINERPELDFIEFEYAPDDCEANDAWTKCTIGRKDRTRPLTIVEYYRECYRDTTPWNTTSRRMLRHRALIQCARIAFGFGGIYDPDEAARIADANAIDGEVVTPKSGTHAPRAISAPADLTATALRDQPEQALITEPLLQVLRKRLEQFSVSETRLREHFQVADLADLRFDQVDPAFDWIAKADAGA